MVYNREKWTRQLEYMLSVIGMIVGFGNIWRFPYICMINGGGAFLIPYLIFLILCGVPAFFLECILGQFTSKPITKVWELCPLLKGVGVGMVLIMILISVYYNILLGWISFYLYCSFKSPLPWSSCGNDWNTKSCLTIQQEQNISFTSLFNTSLNDSGINEFRTVGNVSKRVTSPAEEFWRNGALQISQGLTETGDLVGHMSVATLVSYVVIFFCLFRGIKSVGKVVYVTAILPYVLLLAILIKGVTLPGSLDGIIFYLKPDFEKLLDTQVWVQAGIQVFYSLGPGWGSLITMASFNKFDNNCYRDSLIIAACGEGSSVFAGLVIFSVLGFMAHRSNVPVSEVVQSGPGLAFVVYPDALAQLPFPNVWSIVFFLAMFSVGLDSLFGNIESIFDALKDAVPIFRRRPLMFRGFMLAMFYILGLMFCTEGGMYFYQLVDWYITAMGPFIFSFLGCIIVGWIYGLERFSRDIELMLGRGPPVFIRICWCFITPMILAALQIFAFVTYKPPKYGNYVYPDYVEVIGWILAFIPILPIFIVACKEISVSPGATIKQKFVNTTKPSNAWGPAAEHAKVGYYAYELSDITQKQSLLKRMQINALGK